MDAPVETVKEFGSAPADKVKRWLAEIDLWKNDEKQKAWIKRGEKIVKRYRDERKTEDGGDRRYNILWSNVATIRPALYSRTPQPVVERRFKDKDPVGLEAARIIERAVSFCVNEYEFDDIILECVTDNLLPGRGTAWVRYEPKYGEAETTRVPVTEQDGKYLDGEGREHEEAKAGDDGAFYAEESFEPVEEEHVYTDYVYWQDFAHKPCRSWAELKKTGWVARRVYMTRAELEKRFPEVGGQVSLDTEPKMDKDTLTEMGDTFKQAEVWEIWDAPSKKAVWLAPSYKDRLLDEKDDPLKLSGFFPCPKPIFATQTSDTMVPVPDYAEYQDQAEELDEITERIALLTKALKVAGVYDGSIKDDMSSMLTGSENRLIPVDSWAAFASKGGMNGAIAFLPIDVIGGVLTGLYEARERVKQDLYEISGMGDIIRGQGDPDETATAQKIKGRFASLRLEERQRAVAQFARDIIRMKAEIIAEHFDPKTIALMSGYQVMDGVQQNLFTQAVQLLRDDRLRTFRIDIETDSTIAMDEQEEQRSRVEFISASTAFLEKAIPAGQTFPELAPLLGEMLLFGIRSFRAGRPLEVAFEKAVDAMENKPPAQPQPNPEMVKAENEMKLKAQAQQVDGQLQAQKMQQEGQLRAAEMQQSAQLETRQQDIQAELALRDQDLKAQIAENEQRFGNGA